MTVSATPRKAGPFAGTGAQTAFPFTFKIFATTDVVVNTVVAATGALATPVNGVDYTVAMNADQENAPGGTVNMAVAPAVGVSLVISSAVPSTQSVAVTNNGGFFPAVFNAEFDRLTVLIQQLEEKATRTFSSPITAAGVSGSVAPVANAVLVWDGAGQNILSIPQATLAANLVYNNTTYQAAIATTLAAVTVDVIPDVDATRSLGSNAKRWLNAFISGVLSWGSSAAAPMLKRVGATLAVRLGDDSADATLTAKTQAYGDSATNAATTGFVQAALPGGYAFRNLLVNGNFDYWQRGTSQTTVGYGSADRWKVASITAVTVARAASPDTKSKYVLQITPSNAANALDIGQSLIASRARRLVEAGNATFSIAGKCGAGVANATILIQKSATADDSTGGGGWTTIGTQVCALTVAEQTFSVSAAIPNDGSALGLRAVLQTTNTPNGVALTFRRGQLEGATSASPFEYRPEDVELRLCEQHCETNFDIGVTPADNIVSRKNNGTCWTTPNLSVFVPFKTRKYKTPTVAFYSGTNVAAPTAGRWNVLNGATWTDGGGATTTTDVTQESVYVSATASFGLTGAGSYIVSGGWKAESEI